MVGCPAGGYFSTTEDLCRFGSWISLECQDPEFMKLVERYGGEFYSSGTIRHAGGSPSSSSFLSILLPNAAQEGVRVAILTNKDYPYAQKMYDVILTHLLHQE